MRVTWNMKHWLALGILFQVCQSVEIQAGSIPKPRPRIPFQAVQPGKGVFLVAKQGMLDPRFRRTVVLLVAHGPSGTLGVIMFLIRSEEPLEQTTNVMGDVYFGGDKTTLERLLEEERGSHQLRLFVGHSGWAPGQLDSELDRGDWRLFRANAFTVFEKRLDSIWSDFMEPPKTEREVASR